MLFGESLGAWTSQDAFAHRGTQGLLDAGVDGAIWIGTPYMSKWKNEVLSSDRPDVDPSLVGRFNDFGELEALAPAARQRLRYVMITHANDAVGHFGLDLLVRVPDWLGPAKTRAATVPGAEQWRSPTTFVQTLVDMKNAANVVPGQFEARATTTVRTWPGSSARSTGCRPATRSSPPSSGPASRVRSAHNDR